jgi:hypothetical protein
LSMRSCDSEPKICFDAPVASVFGSRLIKPPQKLRRLGDVRRDPSRVWRYKNKKAPWPEMEVMPRGHTLGRVCGGTEPPKVSNKNLVG